jgi:hypothetical protein
MKAFIDANGGILVTIGTVCVMLNMVLSGVAKALEVLKDSTQSQADDKAYTIVTRIISALQTVISWTSGGRAAPAKTAAAVAAQKKAA